MKKFTSVLITVLLLCLATGAMAQSVRFVEDSATFDIEMPLPEGASMISHVDNGGMSIMTIASEGLAHVRVAISPSELFDDRSMNDLSDEEITALGAEAGSQFENPEIKTDATPSGNKYIHICANFDSDVDSIFTLYKGYFIEMTQWHDDYAPLSDKDLDFMLQLLYNLEFLPLS